MGSGVTRLLAAVGVGKAPETESVARVTRQMSSMLAGGISPERMFELMLRGEGVEDRAGGGAGERGADGTQGRASKDVRGSRGDPGSAGRTRRGGRAREKPRGRGKHAGDARRAPEAEAAAAAAAEVEVEVEPGTVMGENEGARVARRVVDGETPAAALAAGERPEWRVIAAAWVLAENGGAPLGPALARMSDALAALERLRERRGVILAGPRATVATVAALPPLALVLGVLLGFDPAPILGSAMGAVLLVSGGALLTCGVWWATALQRQVETADHVAGLEFELAWIALRGGADPLTVTRLVVDAVDGAGAEWVPFASFLSNAPLSRAINGAAAAGIPLAGLLLEEAESERAVAHTQLERDAERLGIRVLIPLAACVLPSFILVGVVPVVLSMLGV